jgi:hypothetical protein
MFELNLAYVAQADREREVEADLRRRLALKPRSEAIEAGKPAPIHASDAHRRPVRLGTAGR